MELKENIKSKVDKLDDGELRIVDMLIDSLKLRKQSPKRKLKSSQAPFLKVINLIGKEGLSTEDIYKERAESSA